MIHFIGCLCLDPMVIKALSLYSSVPKLCDIP